jgi:sugar/nucleoside kinase (ribokinase family)
LGEWRAVNWGNAPALRPDIVGLGLATVDILTLVPRLPERDDVYAVRQILLEGGGPVATALVAASRLGAKTVYLGSIAPTRWGSLTREGLESEGVDTRFAPTRNRGEQAVAVILVDQTTGQRSILYDKGEMTLLAPGEVPTELITSARALHLDGNQAEAALHAAKVARQAGVTVSLDGGAGGPWPGMEELLPLVDLLVVARRFAERHTGEREPLRAGPALVKAYSPQQVVITDGTRGCWYWDAVRPESGDCIHQPALGVDVVDTTGAGDVFHGAYLHAYLQGWEAKACLAYASAAAALKCRQLGGRAGIPTRGEVAEFLKARGVTGPAADLEGNSGKRAK